jgi:hypothetical protein
MSKKSYSLTKWLIQLSLGLLLAIGGIWGLQGGGDFGINALKKVFDGSAENIIVIVFSVVELLAGLYLVLELFIGDLGKFDNILMLIIMIVWIVAIVLSDFINGDFNPFIPWLWDFASHLVVLGAIFYCKD